MKLGGDGDAGTAGELGGRGESKVRLGSNGEVIEGMEDDSGLQECVRADYYQQH